MTKIKKQMYLCVELSTRMQDHDIRMGETRKGVLTMVEDQEKFTFDEVDRERWTRNPKVFQGEYINVHRDKNGHYQIHLRKMELNKRFSPIRVGNAIQHELLTAKKVLGL